MAREGSASNHPGLCFETGSPGHEPGRGELSVRQRQTSRLALLVNCIPDEGNALGGGLLSAVAVTFAAFVLAGPSSAAGHRPVRNAGQRSSRAGLQR